MSTISEANKSPIVFSNTMHQRTYLRKLADEDLIKRCQRDGNSIAMDELARRYDRYLTRIIHRVAPDWASMHDDIKQEALLRMCKNIHTLVCVHAFKTWLAQIVANLYNDEFRRRSKMKFFSIDDAHLEGDGYSWLHETKDKCLLPDEIMFHLQIRHEVCAAIGALPEVYRNVVEMRDIHGLPYEVIATAIGANLGTVKSRINRGRAKLQPKLDHLRCA